MAQEDMTTPYLGVGRLQVSVWLGSPARPLENVTVRILEVNTQRVLEELFTNRSGQTAIVSLPAPPLAFSMDPEMPRPFSMYDLQVSVDGRTLVQVEPVQIYPDTTAIQNIKVESAESIITVPYPVLWGDFPPKIPEKAIKVLPPPTDLAVLARPIIPEYVVVHAGAPSNVAAQNYTVTFQDYVKNVASSEIYASWPHEALRANVLAIQSFTLNRVFTEWYRGKGYDFTITNSTAYDQAFTYGRPIYREISDVVDELFTTYITKLDIRQPLFTQYSDGRLVVRPGWLSQWGSKELADQGYTAYQILRHYYGSDIILKQAEKVVGIPLSFPGYVLKRGSKGEPVSIIQNQLNAISESYPAIPKLVEDGSFGVGTERAVKKFQEIFQMPVTGEVNFPTWYNISNIYVAVQKLA